MRRSIALALLLSCSGPPPSLPETPAPAPAPIADAPTPAKVAPEPALVVEDRWLADLLAAEPAAYGELLADPSRYRLQILVTILEPGRAPVEHGYRVDAEYTYPASAIKTFASVAALLELQRLQDEGNAVDVDTPLVLCAPGKARCRERRDASNRDGGVITLRHEIRKMQLVSDNRAFNRLYDFVGHRALNERLRALGFDSLRIHHRMYDSDDPDVRRTTARMELRPASGAPIVVPARTSDLELPPPAITAGVAIGEAYLAHGRRVPQPLSFRDKNAVSLRDLHRLCLALARPELAGVPALGLSDAHRELLVGAMAEDPHASANPVYRDPAEAAARYKPMLRGAARVLPLARIRYVSKAGRAFGFHLDNAYIEDGESGRAIAVTAVLYANADGVLDDNRYEYETVTRPFFDHLGETLVRAALVR